MEDYPIKIIPYSAHALLIQWPEQIEESILRDIMAYKNSLQIAYPDALLTPCYCSLLVVFKQIIKDYQSTIEQVLAQYERRMYHTFTPQLIEVPVDYQSKVGMDLGMVCETLNMNIRTFIEWHTQPIYTVFGLGFLPGFMYLGGLPKAIHFPRRASPRLQVPAGAVGIGGHQTGIYPFEAPGGWQLIGHSNYKVLDRKQGDTFRVKVGDRIRFIEK